MKTKTNQDLFPELTQIAKRSKRSVLLILTRDFVVIRTLYTPQKLMKAFKTSEVIHKIYSSGRSTTYIR